MTETRPEREMFQIGLFVRSDVDDSDLDVYEFRVYAHLCRRAGSNGHAWPSLKSIGETCGIGKSTAQKAVYALRDKGWIRLIPRKRGDGSASSNDIIILGPPMPSRGTGVPPHGIGIPSENREVYRVATDGIPSDNSHEGNPLKGNPIEGNPKKEKETAPKSGARSPGEHQESEARREDNTPTASQALFAKDDSPNDADNKKQPTAVKVGSSAARLPPKEERLAGDSWRALLAVPGFAEAWKDWRVFRIEKKKPLTDATIKFQLRMLSKVEDPVDMIVYTLEKGYEGLLERNPSRSASKPPKSAGAPRRNYDDD